MHARKVRKAHARCAGALRFSKKVWYRYVSIAAVPLVSVINVPAHAGLPRSLIAHSWRISKNQRSL